MDFHIECTKGNLSQGQDTLIDLFDSSKSLD